MALDLIGPALTSRRKLEEVILWEVEQRYCRRKGTFTGTGAAGVTVDYPIGTVMKGAAGAWTVLAAGDAGAGATAILAEHLRLVGNATQDCAGLEKGPALINQDALTYYSGVTAPHKAAYVALLVALGFKMVSEPIVKTDKTAMY